MDFKELVFKKIRKLTKKDFDIDTPIRGLNIDSLDLVILISELETNFNIEITDDELMKIKTIGDVLEIIEQKKSK
ncbi:Putative acyl carrier protein [Metamycoplasma auris 15026]|uniref:Putative acyl carrier protein n=1 Tax=Metamycoplasma auris 15026 TaxID=1188233 RepID=N9TRC3_9BACT|nr:phosphopantetheine-binding protein [Metamycoplasma auris]ENY68694.1 Putative acyl carrier protein [Metamycoplasma auris 15026]